MTKPTPVRIERQNDGLLLAHFDPRGDYYLAHEVDEYLEYLALKELNNKRKKI